MYYACSEAKKARLGKKRANIVKIIDLQHFFMPENYPDRAYHSEHQGGDRSPGPRLRIERQSHVHSVETRNQRRRHKEQGNEGEDLHNLVLFEVDEAQNRILQVLKPFESEIDMVDERGDILEDDTQFLVH